MNKHRRRMFIEVMGGVIILVGIVLIYDVRHWRIENGSSQALNGALRFERRDKFDLSEDKYLREMAERSLEHAIFLREHSLGYRLSYREVLGAEFSLEASYEPIYDKEKDGQRKLLNVLMPNHVVLPITETIYQRYFQRNPGAWGMDYLRELGIKPSLLKTLSSDSAARLSHDLIVYATVLRFLVLHHHQTLRAASRQIESRYSFNSVSSERLISWIWNHSINYIASESSFGMPDKALWMHWSGGTSTNKDLNAFLGGFFRHYANRIWRQAQDMVPKSDYWITKKTMEIAISTLYPIHVDKGLIEFPLKDSAPISCPLPAIYLACQSGKVWKVLERLLQNNPDYAALSPQAAQYLVGVLSAMAIISVQKAGEFARAKGLSRIDQDSFRQASTLWAGAFKTRDVGGDVPLPVRCGTIRTNK